MSVVLDSRKTGEVPGRLDGAGLTIPRLPEPLPSALHPIATAILHLLVYGQSNSNGTGGRPPLSLTQPYNNLTFNGGPRKADAGTYAPAKALVEDEEVGPSGNIGEGETVCSGAANTCSRLAYEESNIDPADLIFFASTGGDPGEPIADLMPVGDGGNGWYESVLLPQIDEAFDLAPGGSYSVPATPFIQGENDALTGTSFATYLAALELLQSRLEDNVQAVSGQTSPLFFLLAQISARVTLNKDVALAQLYAAKNNPLFCYVGPTYPFGAYMRPDELHLTNIAHAWLGAYIGKALKTLIVDKCRPQFLNPLFATVSGSEVRVRFEVPYPPMVIGKQGIGLATDYGFKVLDDATPATISSIIVQGSDVVITLSSAPSGVVIVRYALDYLGTGLTISDGASGNLRDSDPRTTTIDGTSYPLWNWSPHFELTAT